MELSFSMNLGSESQKQNADVFIIGGGPASVTAAIYLKRKEVDVGIISETFGGEVGTTGPIDNYPGLPSIPGPELVKKFREHLNSLGVDLISDRINRVEKTDNGFRLIGSKEYSAKAVIIATGSRYRHLKVPGEEELIGKGVSYCATCDAPLYKGRTVAIVGGGNTAMIDAQELAKIAKKVYVIHRRDEFRADAIEVERVKKFGNVEFILNSVVTEVAGSGHVEKVKIHNKQTDEDFWLETDALFVAIGMIPNTELVKGMVELNDYGEIKVDMNCRTSHPLIYAAGDVTNVRDKQIIIAAGMGATAALSAYDDLRTRGLI